MILGVTDQTLAWVAIVIAVAAFLLALTTFRR